MARLVSIISLLYAVQAVVGLQDCRKEFGTFVKKYKRTFLSMKEMMMRELIFLETCEWIKVENQKNHSYTLGITQFSDLHVAEFNTQYYRPSQPVRHVLESQKHVRGTKPLEDSVDWADKMTSIKDQGPCGTCWAFGSTGSMEPALAIAGYPLVSLSTQELQDCDGQHSCSGDDSGGSPTGAFDYARENGMHSNRDYRNIKGSEYCQSNLPAPVLRPGVISGYRQVDQSMEALMDAVAQQPVTVSLNAERGGNVQNYQGGIITADCQAGYDHSVVVMGYGTENGIRYWRIKNSWGADWGENGYFRLERGKDQCGLLDDANYPTVARTNEANVVV